MASTVAQFETYLEASRRPELRPDVERVLVVFEYLAEGFLEFVGAPRSRARAFVALVDGFILHRVAVGRSDDDAQTLHDALLALLHGCSGEGSGIAVRERPTRKSSD